VYHVYAAVDDYMYVYMRIVYMCVVFMHVVCMYAWRSRRGSWNNITQKPASIFPDDGRVVLVR